MSNAKAEYFDGIADKWDGWEDLEVLGQRLAAGLRDLGVAEGETVIDVGCGTGNLTKALLEHVGAKGRVIAVDISPRMIEAAKRKVADARVSWHVADARWLPLAPSSCDRIVCFSVWPHFDSAEATAQELARVLKPSGVLHIWHLISRQRVNAIHASAGPVVERDLLRPAEETSDLLLRLGFEVMHSVDVETHYLVSARKLES